MDEIEQQEPLMDCAYCGYIPGDEETKFHCFGCRRWYHEECCPIQKKYFRKQHGTTVIYCTHGLCKAFVPFSDPLLESFLNYPLVRESLKGMLTHELYKDGRLICNVNSNPMTFMIMHPQTDTMFPIDTADIYEKIKSHAFYRQKAFDIMAQDTDSSRITFVGDSLTRTYKLPGTQVLCDAAFPRAAMHLNKVLEHLIVTNLSTEPAEKVYFFHHEQFKTSKQEIGISDLAAYSKELGTRENKRKHNDEFATGEILAMLKRVTQPTIVQQIIQPPPDQVGETAKARSLKYMKINAIDMTKFVISGITSDDTVFRSLFPAYKFLMENPETQTTILPGVKGHILPWTRSTFRDYFRIFDGCPALSLEHVSMSLFYGAANAMEKELFYEVMKDVKGSETRFRYNRREFKLVGLFNFLPQAMLDQYFVGELANVLSFFGKTRNEPLD